MCGKFTAMASWRKVVRFSQPLEAARDDEIVTYRVAGILPVILGDPGSGERRIVPMQWGFPHPREPRRPQPIHARSETVDTTPAFAQAFREGQRGIVAMRTFNEGEDIGSKTVQWTVEPGDGVVRGLAFIWRRFEIPGRDTPLLACVLCTVPASRLIGAITDRMPAVLDEADWPAWLGETAATPEAAKALLRTREDSGWRMTREEKVANPRKKPVDGAKRAAPGQAKLL